jgi:hypothetical protein
MALTTSQIRAWQSDDDLLRVLQGELDSLFPPESRRDNCVFLSRLQSAPEGLRAMAATFELDVSMSLDDLAWHFVNHHDLDLYEETKLGLRTLGAMEAAELFEAAFAIVEPLWHELGTVAQRDDSGSIHAWLDQKGIQKQIDPLDGRMWKLLGQWPKQGLMHYWVTYAREHPRQCIRA